IGAFGTSILILAVLAKNSALTSMNPTRLDASIITAQIFGRLGVLPIGFFNRPATGGSGAEFLKGLTGEGVVIGTLLSSSAAVLLCRRQGTLALALAVAVIALASVYFRRRLGGVTGDCFGATFQFVEIATYAAFLT